MHVHSFWAINIVKHSILCGWHFSFFQQIATEANWAKHTSAQWLNDMCRANYVTGWQTLILPGCRHPLAFWDRWTGENYASPVVKQRLEVSLGRARMTFHMICSGSPTAAGECSHGIWCGPNTHNWLQWQVNGPHFTILTSVTRALTLQSRLQWQAKGPHFTV